MFQQNYQLYHSLDLKEHLLTTKPDKRIENRVLKASDIIVKENLLWINNLMLWDIKCTLYCITISCKELNNDVNETVTTIKKSEQPKWLLNITNSIARIRKLIAHVNIVIQCKKEEKFSKH